MASEPEVADLLRIAQADCEEWERKTLAAEMGGNEAAMQHCLRKWDQALARRDRLTPEAPNGK